MAIPNCEYFEVLLPDSVQKHGLIEDIEVDAQGMVHAPTEPGLGARIDFDLIEKNKVAELWKDSRVTPINVRAEAKMLLRLT